MSVSSDERRIALVIGRNDAFGRGVVSGIYGFARPSHRWRLELVIPHPDWVLQEGAGRFDGAIAQFWGGQWHVPFGDLGIPVVNISGGLRESPFPQVTVDNEAVGRMAGEHFLSRGFRHFAYVGDRLHWFSQQRSAGLQAALVGAEAVTTFSEVDGRELSSEWLASRPTPLAVLGCSDSQALSAVEAAEFGGLEVPQRVAVMGVNNDEMICQLSYPPLSSISLPLEQIGYRAADLLSALLEGQAVPRRAILLEPDRVVVRASSDTLAVADPDVAAALRYIHSNAGEPLSVDQVVGEATVSRRSLEMRFRESLGCSILGAIRRAHVDRAAELLRQTDLRLEQVARASGFNSAARLSVVFRQAMGVPPGRYRRQAGSVGGDWKEKSLANEDGTV